MSGTFNLAPTAIAEHRKTQVTPLPEEIQYLAGLQQIKYVFVYPEQNDIVLVGPAEGWKVAADGSVVGQTTGKPVLLLDDLLVALRAVSSPDPQVISCSIDATPEGVARMPRAQRGAPNVTAAAAAIERALGPQVVTITGIPADSHFAAVLVAADYRMKQIGMGHTPSPVSGLPSFLEMMQSSSRTMKNMMPRWWLEPNYQPILASPDGLAWELRGASVKCMTESDFVAASGQKQVGAKASPMAQRRADNMTQHYDELAAAEPIFGELRNCMELAIVAALIVKERLPERASYYMPVLLDPTDVPVDEMVAPRQIDSKVSMVRKRGGWVISASGGVMLNSWQIADRTTQDAAPAEVRASSAATDHANWWWN